MVKFFHLERQTLRVRLTAWYMLLLALALVLFSSYLYLQLEKSLIAQLDTTLEVTASQALDKTIKREGHPAFQNNSESEGTTDRLIKTGLAVRLVDVCGTMWDGFGNYAAIPAVLPTSKGYVNLTARDTTWRVYSQPLPGNDRGWLQVAESLEPTREVSEHLLALMLLGFPLMLSIAGFGGLFLADRALRPIDRIIRTAQAISSKDFTQRIGYRGPADEVGRLATTLDRMLDRLQEAFERERHFTADAAHELRTPLTAIKGRIGVALSRSRTPAESENTLQDLEQEVNRLIRLANGLLYLSRLEQQEQLPSFSQGVDLSNLLTAFAEQMQPLAQVQHIHLDAQIAPGLLIQGNPDYLTNLVLNLLDNALKHTPPGGRVTLRSQQQGDRVEVTVQDTGIGIDDQYLPHLFDRFYRVEGARSRSTGGAGLGLAISAQIARLHGGTLSVRSFVDRGTTFMLQLPGVRR